MNTKPIPKRISAFLLCFALLVGLLPTSVLAAEEAGPFQITVNDGNTAETPYTYTTANDEWSPSFLTVNDGADITVSNKDSTQSPTTHIVIAENATVTITLKGVNITGIQEDSHNGETVPSPIDLSSGATLTLTLAEGSTNTLTGGAGTSSRGSPGIHVPDGATLIIQGSGSLSVTGGTYISGYGAPGIGGRTDVSESDHNNFCGENCGTVIILPGGSVKAIGGTGSGGRPAADIGGGRGDPDGDDGQGIKPTGNGTYAVFGDLTLPCDISIPAGATVVIPEGASLTVPEGTTLTNNGTILVQGGTYTNEGTLTGNPPAYPSTVTVSFSQNGQSVTSVPYGSTVTLTATMEKTDSAANTLRADTGTVDFYLGTAEGGTKLNQTGVSVTQGSDGTYTAALNVTLEGEQWKPSDSPYTITADFGGYAPSEDRGGDSLAPNTGSAQLTVTKAQQAAPTGGFVTTSRTDSSITLHFSVSNQSANKNGLEFAYAAGMTADAPTSTWTTASLIGTSPIYSATVGQLSHGTPYVFFVRYKGDAYHEPSPVVVNNRFLYTKPKITTESLPNAYVGEPYSHQLQALAADGVAVKWSITSGSLPDGLTLSSDGTISGTPTTVTPQAVSLNISAALGDPDIDFTQNEKSWTISVTKSDAELGNLTVSGSTGIPEGTFQYGDTIRVTFTPRRQASAAADTLTPDTATLTYTPDGGEPKQLATASAQADGSFTLTYDTKQKMLPIKANLPLTVSYGGSGALNPVTETVFVTLQKGMLRNRPSISGSFAYGETLTVNYTKQDDETVSYQWLRSDSTGYTEIDGETSTAYTLTEEDIGKHIYVEITPAYDDEWHTGLLQSAPQVVTKAPQTAPSAPTAAGTTTYSVTLNTIPANANGAAAEYGISKDGGKIWTWQSGPEFTGLSSNTTYQFAARYGETDKYMTSDPSAPANIATDRRSSGGGSSHRYDGPSTGDSDGWRDIRKEIGKAKDGDTITIDMGDETEVPGEIFEEVAGRDVTVEFELEGGVSWAVNGEDIPENTRFADLDLGVDMGTKGIPVSVFNAVTGEYSTVQFTLAHDGKFGFTLTLTAPLGRNNAGYWANLYHYNEKARELEFVTCARIARDGSAALRLEHASQYAVVIDDKSHEPVDLPFRDVPEGYWAYGAIRYAYGEGLMAGTSGSTFSPEGITTRGQIVTILWRLSGSPVVNYRMDFDDVDPAAYYGEAVRWATSEGIAGGYGGGKFGPNDPITREQLAVMLCRFAQHEGYNTAQGGMAIREYTDYDQISGFALEALNWAVSAGIISGTSAATLSPSGSATRAQVAVILMRFCEKCVSW